MDEFARAIQLLPYAPPMLLVDSVQDFDSNQIVVDKVFATTDILVTSHLVGRQQPIVPGVLLVEMVGQASLLHQILGGFRNGEIRLAETGMSGVLVRCKASFFHPAPAGKKLSTRVALQASALGAVLYAGTVTSGGARLAEIEILAKTENGSP